MQLALKEQTQISRLEDSLFSPSLAPHYMDLAKKLATSELVPKTFRGKPQDLFICWAWGYQIGMSPEQAMQCIAVINGKPTMWGDEMLALCMAHQDFEDIIEVPIMKDEAVFGYVCTVKRCGRTPTSDKFDLNDAKKAGLLGKQGPWTQYTERMLKLRARAFALRDSFPDALKGIKSREEVQDYINGEYEVVEKTSRTERLKQDLLSKTSKLEVEESVELDNNDTDSIDNEAPEKDSQHKEMDQAGSEETRPILELARLLEEKGFQEDRLIKALQYYEVDSIGALTFESASHFIEHLRKL